MSFIKIDNWAGWITKEMYDSQMAELSKPKAKAKNKRKIELLEALDQSTFAKTRDDIWILDETPYLRMNLNKCLPISTRNHLFESEEEQKRAEIFEIGRRAFQNQIMQQSQYLSYFIEFYDKEKDLMTMYINIKNMIDNGTQSLTVPEYKKRLLGKMLRDYNLKEKIYNMVDDNFYIDITIDPETGRVFDGPDDFTNEEAKMLLAVSMAHKIIISPTEHYICTNTIYDNDDIQITNLMLDLFVELFYAIGDRYGKYEADLIEYKLYRFAERRISKHFKGNKKLWVQQAALRGTTENNSLDELMVKTIMSDNFFKLNFSYALTKFLKAVIGNSLNHSIIQSTYKYNPVRVTNEKDSSGLSSIDKLNQTSMKLDMSRVIRSYKSLEYVTEKLEKRYGEISEAEIDFYEKRLDHTDKFHNDLLNYNFAKEFHGFAELKIAPIRNVIKFVVICKRELSDKGYSQLQWLISSVLQGKLSNRLLQNNKYLDKLKKSSLYQHLITDKYMFEVEDYKDDPILQIISRVLNNYYTFNEYTQPELTGERIYFDENIISDELLTFIDEI